MLSGEVAHSAYQGKPHAAEKLGQERHRVDRQNKKFYTGGNNINLFTQIKMAVSVTEAAEYYGVVVKRGKALCPFHNDHHPSMLVADDHYHCYACGEHGDVIDFVAKLYGLSLHEAAKKLAYDFGIQTDKPPSKAMQEKWNRKTEAQRLRETEKLCFSALMAYFHLLEDWQVAYAPKAPEDEVDSRFTEVCQWLPQVEYWVDVLLSGDSYERGDVVNVLMTDGKLEKLQNHLKKHGKGWSHEQER